MNVDELRSPASKQEIEDTCTGCVWDRAENWDSRPCQTCDGENMFLGSDEISLELELAPERGIEMTVKPLVIYHADCADGFGAAFAAWLKFGEWAEYLPMQYGKIDYDSDGFFNLCEHEADNPAVYVNNREVYILDFSFPRQVMESLFPRTKKVVWLDHHKTAFEMWCGEYKRGMHWLSTTEQPSLGLHYIELNDNKSGAMLAWEYFHPDKEVPMLIKHIDDSDRWQFKLEGTKEFNKALWSYAPWSFKQWHHLFFYQTGFSVEDGFANYNELYPRFYTEGAAILRAHEANVQAVVKRASRECIISFNWTFGLEHVAGLAANCPPHLASDVGHALATQCGTYGLLWHINKEGKCLCSLRSNGDYDVSAIAKTFGGGGHKNAAGFEVPIQTLLEWIK